MGFEPCILLHENKVALRVFSDIRGLYKEHGRLPPGAFTPGESFARKSSFQKSQCPRCRFGESRSKKKIWREALF